MRFSIMSLGPWNEVYAHLFLLSHPFLWYVHISGQIIKFIPGKHTFDIHTHILYTLYTYYIHDAHIYVYICVHICMCMQVCICLYVYVYTCMYICICVCIYIHI